MRHPVRRSITVPTALLVGLSVSFLAQQPAGERPGRIVLGWAGDPATSRTVTWRTSDPVAEPRAQIAVAPPGSAIEKAATTVPALSAKVTLAADTAVYHHSARFEGLQPATRYVYRVGDGKTWSEWFEFVTASAQPAPFRFIYLGDAQNGLNDQWPRTARAAYARAPDARFMVFAGDLLAEGYDDRLWEQWHAGLGFIAASVPPLAVPGNHDEHRAPGSANPKKVMDVSALWRAHFALPENGPTVPGLEGQNWCLDYQGVRFIGLDANPFANEDYVESERARVQQAETAWLEDLLAHNLNRWTVVVAHQTFYSVAKDRDYPELRSKVAPILDRYHVDLVLQGHDHMYSRSRKLFGGRVVGPAEPGTIYVVSVSGSKMYEVSDRYAALMEKMIPQVQLYHVVGVDGDRLMFESYTADGRRVDAFSLVKSAGGSIYKSEGAAR